MGINRDYVEQERRTFRTWIKAQRSGLIVGGLVGLVIGMIGIALNLGGG